MEETGLDVRLRPEQMTLQDFLTLRAQLECDGVQPAGDGTAAD